MKRLLLVGATGLIGATVQRKLSATWNIIRVGRQPECEIKADLSKPESLDLNFVDGDALVHCAGVTDEDFKERTVAAFVQSTVGMNALIKAASASGIRRVVYISSSHVYGRQVGQKDEGSAVDPLNDYALAHYAAEQTIRRHCERFEKCWVLRPNAVFGLPEYLDRFDRWSLIPYSFPLEAIYNERIVLRSSGEQARNFIGTEDLAGYIEALLNSEAQTVRRTDKLEVINPVGKETVSVYSFALRCAEICEKLIGKPVVVERPSSVNESEEPFVYQSKYKPYLATSDLSIYLRDFMRRILEDFQSGKQYGI